MVRPTYTVVPPAGCYVRCVHLAREGTPWVSTRNNMYHPAGATFGFCGTFAVTTPPVRLVTSNSTRRWLPSTECVVTQGRIRLAQRLLADCGALIWIGCPLGRCSG